MRHPVRRTALAVVLERAAPVRVPAVAAAVREDDGFAGTRPGPDRGSLRAALHHRHLPLLADADLIARSLADGTVEPGDHGLLAHPTVDATWLRRDDVAWDGLAAVFGQPRRRVAVAVLAEHEQPIGVGRLARVVAAELVGELSPEAAVHERLEARLHHVDLPMLADAGLLAYDRATGRVLHVAGSDLPLPAEGL